MQGGDSALELPESDQASPGCGGYDITSQSNFRQDQFHQWGLGETATNSTKTSPPVEVELGVVLESLKDLYRESEEFCKKLLPKLQEEILWNKVDTEWIEDIEVRMSELFKKIPKNLPQMKLHQKKVRILQRSLSVDSPRTPPQRFKVKTLDLGGVQQGDQGGTKFQ